MSEYRSGVWRMRDGHTGAVFIGGGSPMTGLIKHKYGDSFSPAPQYLEENASAQTQWLVEDLIPLGYLVLLGGATKSGKSCLITALAVAIAEGRPFAGMRTVEGPLPQAGEEAEGQGRRSSHRAIQPSNTPGVGGRDEGATGRGYGVEGLQPPSTAVLWCAYEESPAERAQVLRAFDPPPERLFVTHDRPKLDTVEGIEMLRYWVRETNAKLIVIDPLLAAVEDDALSHGPTARKALEGLKELCTEEHVTAIVIHHLNKSGGPLGRDRIAESHQLLATASMDIVMESTETPASNPHPGCKSEPSASSHQSPRSILLRCRGRGSFANRTIALTSNGVTDYRQTAFAPGLSSRQSLETPILEALKDRRLTSEQLADELDMQLQAVRRVLYGLVRSGHVETVGKNKWAPIYRLVSERS